MAITVHTHLSPRIIEVSIDVINITIQQIIDTIRDWEDDNLSYDRLIDAAGKEVLGGGVSVGITATLQNARLMFVGRTTPLEEDGTCTTGDPKGRTLYATGGGFETNGVYDGCTVFNVTTGSMATITEVVSDAELVSFALSGGSRATWEINDVYSIYPNVQCAITGGNLVAVDGGGNAISPVMQSPNVQVVRSSASSATLQESQSDHDAIAVAVWDKNTMDHTIIGSFGNELATKADINASTSTHQNTAESSTIIYGTSESGDYTDTLTRDNTYFEIREHAVNGLSVEFTFNLPHAEGRAGVIEIFGRYSGLPAPSHYMNLWIWDCEAESWELLKERFMPGGNTSDDTYTQDYHARNICIDNNNEVKIRLTHNVGSYSDSHLLYLDYVNASSIDVITAGIIANAVLDELMVGHDIVGSLGELLTFISKLTGNKVTKSGDVITIFENDTVTPWRQYNLADGGRVKV